MTEFGEKITKILKERFPMAKVEYVLDGYWDVTTDAGMGTIVDSYKLVNGKLIHFATVEIEA